MTMFNPIGPVARFWANLTSGIAIMRGQYNTQKKNLVGRCIFVDQNGDMRTLKCKLDTAKNMVVPDGVKKAFGNRGARPLDGKLTYLILEIYPYTIVLDRDLRESGWVLERTAMVFETLACELTDWLFTLIMRQHTKSQLITTAIAAFFGGFFVAVIVLGARGG